MENVTLEASLREETGKGYACQLRREGSVPAVLYGEGKPAASLKLERKALLSILKDKASEHGIVYLKIKERDEEKPVIIKERQTHPVRGDILHVDFYEVSLTKKLITKVPINLVGEPKGVKTGGGILEHHMREAEIEVLPARIPDHLEIDISDLELGQSCHLSDIIPIDGVKVIADLDRIVAAVIAPRIEAEKEEEGEEGAGPEVIKEKKKEEEGA
ncbi:50S ribosomal protein L25 [bacterium]|nr:50S ribosomal protein L25 [bacterium]MBU1614136.1 50S ribosomal protein L25 [bacterium]